MCTLFIKVHTNLKYPENFGRKTEIGHIYQVVKKIN